MREVNQAGVNLIKSFEGIMDGNPNTVNLDPYLCPANVWTIGYGHAVTDNGRQLRGSRDRARAFALYPQGITRAEAERLLHQDIIAHTRNLERLVHVPLNDNQYAALASFAFNLGENNLERSSLLRKLNRGDYEGARQEFGKWNKADGQVLAGLVRRRAAEARLFATADAVNTSSPVTTQQPASVRAVSPTPAQHSSAVLDSVANIPTPILRRAGEFLWRNPIARRIVERLAKLFVSWITLLQAGNFFALSSTVIVLLLVVAFIYVNRRELQRLGQLIFSKFTSC